VGLLGAGLEKAEKHIFLPEQSLERKHRALLLPERRQSARKKRETPGHLTEGNKDNKGEAEVAIQRRADP
jgi:hypothetical protein